MTRVFSMGPSSFRRFFSTRRWPRDALGLFGDQSSRKNSRGSVQDRVFVAKMHPKTGSSSFFVQIGSQRVPGHPEAKSCQILIGNCLLEAILEASRPASKPASQAQPLDRVFSTKRTRGQDCRVFSSSLTPNGPRPPGGQRWPNPN